MIDLIVMHPEVNLGVRSYNVGDRFDAEEHLQRKEVSERTIEILKRQQRLGPLTRENYERAMTVRRGDAPKPRGFTRAYLIEKGIIDDTPVEPPPPAEAAKPGKLKGKPKPEPITHRARTAESVQVGDYFRTPRKAGNFLFWDVTKADGELLRTSGFKSAEKADEFIAQIKAGSTESATSARSEGEEEPGDNGGDVQSQSGG